MAHGLHDRSIKYAEYAMYSCLAGEAIINSEARRTRSLEGKSSRIVFPRHLTFVSILLDQNQFIHIDFKIIHRWL